LPDDENVIPFPERSSDLPAEPDAASQASIDDILSRVRSGEVSAIELLEAVRGAMGGFQGVGTDGYGFGRVRPVLLKKGRKRVCFVVRLDLDNARPPIWRRLRLASDLPLSQVHDVIQAAMGWSDMHLHHFQMGSDSKDFRVVPFLTPFDVEEGETDGTLESDVRLDQVIGEPGHRLFYEYDFGDSWLHTIKLETVEPWAEGDPIAVCVAGRRACPPEDVGGIPGYEEVLAALEGHVEPGEAEWMAEKLEWLPVGFDPAAFDLDEVNRALQEGPMPDVEEWHPGISDLMVRDGSLGASGLTALVKEALREAADLDAAVVESATLRYRVLLRTIGRGLDLTAAGYLPTAVVDGLCRELDLGAEWVGKGNREHLTLPVLTLRESATALGLVRKARGRLTVTKAGLALVDDPWRLLDHVRARLPLGRDFERDAGLLGLLYAAAGKDLWQSRAEAAAIASSLGWASSGGGLDRAVSYSAHPTLDVLRNLTGRRESQAPRALIARALLRSKGMDLPLEPRTDLPRPVDLT
jgi:hypothetical protein